MCEDLVRETGQVICGVWINNDLLVKNDIWYDDTPYQPEDIDLCMQCKNKSISVKKMRAFHFRPQIGGKNSTQPQNYVNEGSRNLFEKWKSISKLQVRKGKNGLIYVDNPNPCVKRISPQLQKISRVF